MEFVVARITQMNVANHTPDDFVFVLLHVFEAFSLRVVELNRPHIMAILAMVFIQCVYPCMPLSDQPPIEEVVSILPFVIWCTLLLFKYVSTPTGLLKL